jgi:hypothetical protein
LLKAAKEEKLRTKKLSEVATTAINGLAEEEV